MGSSEVAPFVFDAEAHRFTLGGVAIPGITKTLALTGFTDPTWFTDEARDRGTAVHRACWFLAEGDLNWSTVDPAILPRVKQFEAFLDEYKPKLMMAERPMCSRLYRFGGIPDFVFSFGGELSIVEVKTGRGGLAAKLQTAAQKVLIEENNAHVKIDRRYAFELSGNGGYKFRPHTDPGDKTMFLNMVAAVHRRVNEGELKI